MSPSLYNRVLANIDLYEKFVETTVKDLRQAFIVDILWTVGAPLAIGIIAYFVASVAAFVAAVFVGGVNAIEKVTRGHTMLKSYRSDRTGLKGSVVALRLDINECDESDKACLLGVNKKLKGFMSIIAPPPSPPSPQPQPQPKTGP